MKLNNLKPAEGAVKARKRIGRGTGSGRGGTSTRGHKGAKSRSGYSKKIGFEGGQMPLQRRVPKYGFKNINRVEYKAVNLATLQALAESKSLETINIQTLVAAGFISSTQLVKVLANGTLTAKLTVEAHAFSQKAAEAIEAAGGTVVKL
ncbi:MAG: 50S ribosomal protein L15 [Bacteroidaceae bacterium]|jgi:large subunit ribosomal protein L15|nr:50S ribosomal protein L15 [Bacteroidaceae bacterium]MBO7271661.1 50S ribosomal protein L15 [Bacteroidaceae bacterium]